MNKLTISQEDLEVKTLNQENITIERCPHDKENPYTMIRNDLIRDESISPNCRWLIMYLLSNKEGWRINFKQILKHVKPHKIGRDKLHKIFNEGIQSGYIKREKIFLSKGKDQIKNQTSYYVSETPKFKKSLRRTGFQDTEIQDPENQSLKEEHSLKNEHLEEIPSLKVSQETEEIPKKKSSKSKKKKSERSIQDAIKQAADFSQEVLEFSASMIKLIHKHNKMYRPPKDMTKFYESVEEIIETDTQDKSEILKVFEWAVSDTEKRGDFPGWKGFITGSTKKNPAGYFYDRFTLIQSQMNSRPKRKFAAGSDTERMAEMSREADSRAI